MIYIQESQNGEVVYNLMDCDIQAGKTFCWRTETSKTNTGSKTQEQTNITILGHWKMLPDEVVIEKVRFIVNGSEHGYQSKACKAKGDTETIRPSKTRPLGIPCIWDRLNPTMYQADNGTSM